MVSVETIMSSAGDAAYRQNLVALATNFGRRPRHGRRVVSLRDFKSPGKLVRASRAKSE
jgi:hypothetical protein